jgi:acyl-CoA synthetase (AMP-forming)/AMP-acid ligase II
MPADVLPAPLDFLETVRGHMRARPGKTALRWLERGERPTDQASYADLDAAAGVVAANLRRRGLNGRPVLFLLPQGLDFVRAFLGCLYAGAIAVPVPVAPGRRSQERAAAIARAVRPAALLARAVDVSEAGGTAALLREACPGAPVLAVEELLSGAPGEAPLALDPDSVAFLQYTSGSTHEPKGVVVTHRNLAATLQLIAQAFDQTHLNSCVSWLPLHHDMGLVGCVLQPLYLGITVSLMSPLAFLQRPVRWLRAIHDYEATTAGAPNFAYDLCVRAISDEQLRGLDLSRWTLAFCGAEPIRAATLRRFGQRFRGCGFNERAFYPCYGLAEATLFVSGGQARDGYRTRLLPGPHGTDRERVSCGYPRGDTRLAIVDPSVQAPVAAGSIGEICVSGAQVSPGFWDGGSGRAVPDANRVFDRDGRRWLRTGDLGVMAEGDLHVVGRLKAMIIIRGSNIYAEDVEQTVVSLDACVAAAAAISVLEGPREEGFVLVCEIARGQSPCDAEALLTRISDAVAEAHGVLPTEVLLAPAGAIERTPSGKIQRPRLRERYTAGKLLVIARRGGPVPAVGSS